MDVVKVHEYLLALSKFLCYTPFSKHERWLFGYQFCFENASLDGIKEKSKISMICDDRSHTYFLIFPKACETSLLLFLICPISYLMAKTFLASAE